MNISHTVIQTSGFNMKCVHDKRDKNGKHYNKMIDIIPPITYQCVKLNLLTRECN